MTENTVQRIFPFWVVDLQMLPIKLIGDGDIFTVNVTFRLMQNASRAEREALIGYFNSFSALVVSFRNVVMALSRF